MKLKRIFGALVAAATLAIGGVVATAPAANAAPLSAQGQALCNGAPRCGISTPIKISPDHWAENGKVTVNVTGKSGASLRIKAFAVRWVSETQYKVAAISGELPVTVSVGTAGWGDARVSLQLTGIPAGFDGRQVLIQPADFTPANGTVPANSLVNTKPDEIQVRSARVADTGFAETGTFRDIFHRKGEAGIAGDKYSVQMYRGKWITIDSSGPGVVSNSGSLSVQARVPADTPTGKYATRLVNVTRGINDITPDEPWTYFTWTYKAPPAPKPTGPDPSLPNTTLKPGQPGFSVYNSPGTWNINGRQWKTACEKYSTTYRCRTEIWATQILQTATGSFVRQDGWAFNNLTYLPSPRRNWVTNGLGGFGQRGYNSNWVSGGRQWHTECDTARTGRNGCRSSTVAAVVETVTSGGRTSYKVVNKMVFNNIVQFR